MEIREPDWTDRQPGARIREAAGFGAVAFFGLCLSYAYFLFVFVRPPEGPTQHMIDALPFVFVLSFGAAVLWFGLASNMRSPSLFRLAVVGGLTLGGLPLLVWLYDVFNLVNSAEPIQGGLYGAIVGFAAIAPIVGLGIVLTFVYERYARRGMDRNG
jgi:hypothetical protein